MLTGDVGEAVAELKRQPGEGEVQVHGSIELAQTLLRHDLVDEFQLKMFPVLIGSGKRLFGAGTLPRSLTLAETTTTANGVTTSLHASAPSCAEIDWSQIVELDDPLRRLDPGRGPAVVPGGAAAGRQRGGATIPAGPDRRADSTHPDRRRRKGRKPEDPR